MIFHLETSKSYTSSLLEHCLRRSVRLFIYNCTHREKKWSQHPSVLLHLYQSPYGMADCRHTIDTYTRCSKRAYEFYFPSHETIIIINSNMSILRFIIYYCCCGQRRRRNCVVDGRTDDLPRFTAHVKRIICPVAHVCVFYRHATRERSNKRPTYITNYYYAALARIDLQTLPTDGSLSIRSEKLNSIKQILSPPLYRVRRCPCH